MLMKKLLFSLLVTIATVACTKNEEVDSPKVESPKPSVNVVFNKDSVVDADGNVYHTVTIEHQTWMLEDLRTKHYRNGNPIKFVSTFDSIGWVTDTIGAMCENTNGTIYNNDPALGNLYNWYAVNNSNVICPKGWHVPTSSEWDTLKNVLIDCSLVDIKKYFHPVCNCKRWDNSHYLGLIDYYYWWTSTSITNEIATVNILALQVNKDFYAINSHKKTGHQIRCIKDK